MIRIPQIILALLAAAALPLGAQKSSTSTAPRRPRLPVDADTCDAFAYFRYGQSQLAENPQTAAAAFYWTERLQPDAAVAYYSERVARLMADEGLLRGYEDEDRHTLQSAEVKRIDSLQLRALSIDPFFPQLLNEGMVVAYWTHRIRDDMRAENPDVSELSIDFYVRSALADAGPATRAELAFGNGDYALAARYWAGAEQRYPKNAGLHARRAQALYLQGSLDSARAEMEAALAVARRSDAEKMKFVYESKVLWEYEVGRIEEMAGRDSSAREAYQRALVEDLSFHPAHVRLAAVAQHGGDAATAATELERALAIKADDYDANLQLGLLQAARHGADSATAHLRRAAEIEPWVAQPHFALGEVLRSAGDRAGAAAEYRRFLSLAAQAAPDRATAQQRLTELGAPSP